MALKEQISQIVVNEIGGVVVVETVSGKIAYADMFFEKIYGRDLTGEPAEDVMMWIGDCPKIPEDQKTVEWETIDIEKHNFYKVVTRQLNEDGICYCMHHLTDITEYMKLNHDVTKYMSFFKKLAGFQTAILEKLSSTYYELLPMLADFFKTDEMFFLLHRDAHIEMITYNKKSGNYSNARIAAGDDELCAFEIPVGKEVAVDDFAMPMKEALILAGIDNLKKLHSLCHGSVSEQKYALFFVENAKMDKESMGEETLLSVIRLYIENSMMREKLIYDSEHDGLTGMYNKGKYLAMLESEYQTLDSIGIFNFDVNNLKKMNDTYGHEAGDRLIIKGADSIRKVTSSTVHGYRMGGDEFLMIACNVTEEEVLELKERWEKELARLNTLEDGIECVIAAGVVYGEKGYDFAALMKEADERMYEDKKKKKKPGEEIR
ncbi:MAG: GGDEF domain-containing protein [Lachnospiraceae bacterium]|nr:GGDEF domain-containing protein [Lachnospiraceae bacterium]